MSFFGKLLQTSRMRISLICGMIFFAGVTPSFAQYDAAQFPVPAHTTYQQRYDAMKNLWLSGKVYKYFIVGTVEMGGLKLQAKPGNQAIKDSVFACLQNQPVTKNFGFNLFSGMQGYLLGKASFSSAADQKLWRDWLGKANFFKGYIGSNQGQYIHWSAVHLITQEWPDFVDSAGNRADTLSKTAKSKLSALMHATFHTGDHDRGDEVYSSEVTVALKLLATYSKDATIRKQAEAAYFSTLANYATGWNNGLYTAPALREKAFNQSGPFDPLGLYTTAWTLFGNSQGLKAPPSWVQFLFHFPSYLDSIVPVALTELGTTRNSPIAIRASNDLSHPYTWHTPSYSLTSMWLGGWERNRSIDYTVTSQRLKWHSDKPGAVFVIGHENYASSILAGTTGRNAYGLGYNPFSRVFQHQATQLGVINKTDTSYRWQAQYAMFSKSGSILARKDTANWIFGNAGKTFFGLRFARAFTKGTDSIKGANNTIAFRYDYVRSDYAKNGWILETAEASRYANIASTNAGQFLAFVNDVLKNTSVNTSRITDSLPALSYKSIYGYTVDLAYDPRPPFVNAETMPQVRRVNGVDDLAFSKWPALSVTGNLAAQARNGDTLFLNGKTQKAMIVWNQGLVRSSTSNVGSTPSTSWNYALTTSGATNWYGGLYIGYRLPSGLSGTAQLVTSGGSLIKSIVLPAGSVASRFTSVSGKAPGTYSVRLFVNGVQVASKTVVKL